MRTNQRSLCGNSICLVRVSTMFETLKPDEEEEISKCFNVVAVAIGTISWAPMHPVHLSLGTWPPRERGPLGLGTENVGELIRGTTRPTVLYCLLWKRCLKTDSWGAGQLPVEERKRNIKIRRTKLILTELQRTKDIQSNLCFAV